MGKSEYRASWPLRIAMILLCLTMVSTHLLSGLYARYSSTVTGTDTARVALFDVTATPADASRPIALDKDHTTVTWDFTIHAETETKWDGVVQIKFPDGARLPIGVTVTVHNANAMLAIPRALTETLDPSGDIVYQASLASFPYGVTDETYTLTFTADIDSVLEDTNFPSIDIQVLAMQTD